MVAIFSGSGLGFQRSSASVVGTTGALGDAAFGRGGDNVMVNAATGNLIVSRKDEFLVGRGPDAAYAQTYNSQGDAAYTWSQSVYHVLTNIPATPNVAGSTIVRGDGDGRSTVYTYDAARGAYLNTEGGGAHDELRYASGAWTWTDGDSRTRETYTALSGVPGYQFLASVIDADGNSQTYSWNTNGTLQRITNANGDYVQFTQGALGLPTQITTYTSGGTALLTRTRYVWDSSRRLTSVTVDLTPGDHSVVDGKSYTTTYTYDGTSSRIASISQTDGSRLDIAYTQSGADFRVTKLTQTVSTGVTRVTGLYYDVGGRTTTITDPLGGSTTMRYDAAGNLIQVTYPTPAPATSAPSTSFTYNAAGDIASVTTAGRTTAYTYDANGNLTLSRDAAGSTVTRTYGSKNELLTSTEYLVADPDGAGAGVASSPVTARYAYDSENHLRFKVSEDGRVTEYRYDAAGNPISTLRYTANLYPISGLAATSSISESTLAAWAAAVSDKTTIERTDAVYDYRGNVSTVTTYSKTLTDGSGDLASTYSRTYFVYDASGNLLSRQMSGQTGVESYIYDGLNRVVSTTDATGATTSFTFNDAATTTSVTLAGGLTRVSLYNRAGELISVTESGADIVTAVTNRAYDALGRLRMETDPSGRSKYFFYDSASRKVAEITGDGAMTEYGYDASNRLVKSISYMNRLSTSQIALLSSFSAGGAGGATAGGISAQSGGTILTNGSFETSGAYTPTATGRSNTDLPGWVKVNPETFEQVASGQMGVAASDGSYWLDLESIAKSGVMTVGSNLLVNGGFEQSGTYTATATGRSNPTLPGWAKTNAETFEQVTSGQMGVTATEGTFWLDMESVAQTGMMTTGSNLLVNPSFDQSGAYTDTATGRSNTSLPGWVKINAETFEQVASGQMGINGSDGAYWLDLESTASPGPQPVGSNLVVNGSFEQSTNFTQTGSGRSSTAIPGWSKSNPEVFDQVLAETTQINATDGVYWLDLDSVAAPAGSGPNLLVNGSFEQSATNWAPTMNGRMNSAAENIPGWVKANSQGFEQMNSGALGVAATDGSFYLDMESVSGAGSKMDISQTVGGLTAGQQLTLKFDYANIAGTVLDIEGSPENSGALEVYWNGLKIGIVTAADASMTTKTFNVSAIAGNNTLRFKEIGIADGKGVYLDNVRLFANVPATGVGNMDIYQTIPNLTAGQVMQLQFDYSSRTSAASGSFEVWWNSTLVATINDGGGLMKAKVYNVNAIAGNNTLRFKGIGTADGLGAALDNVRLFATQTPPHGGNMDISQTVGGLTAGQVMQLQFDHANRTTAASGSFEVWWNGALVATVADTNTAMQTKTYQLTAIAGNNTLRFRSTGTVDAAGASLDNVRLFAMVPVPTGGNMDISQTVGGLTAGQTMQIQFDHANRTTAASGSFEVWWNSTLVATISETNPAMQTKTYLVSALAGNNTLRFKSLGTVDNNGASIDNVRLFATQPVPSGGNMDISQTVGGLAAGQVMQLHFDHANRASGPSGTFEVWWNGALVATIAETGTAMRTKTYYLNAVAGNNTLRFKSLGAVDDAGASIDNVRLFAMQSGGGPAAGTPTDPLAGLRPGASAGDDWTWRIYDSADRVIETIDSVGRATLFSYDGASNLVSSTAYATHFDAGYISFFKGSTPVMPYLPGSNSATDRSTRCFYDNEGRLVGTLDGAGGLSQVFHDAAGQKIREIAYANVVPSNLRLSGTFAQLIASVGTSAADRRTDHVYDQRGLVRFTIDSAAHPTEYVYDSAGQLIRTVNYAGSITASASYSLAYVQSQITAYGLASNAATRTTRSVLDGAGRVAFSIDAEGATKAFVYDLAGNVIKETRYAAVFGTAGDQSLATMQSWASGQASNAANRVTRQIYDSTGRAAYVVDAEGFVTERRYDTADRITQTIRYAAAYSIGDGATKASVAALIGAVPGDAVVTSYVYDSAGRLTDLTDGAGVITRYTYDGLGQVIDETVGFNTTDASTLRRTYDPAGRVISETRGYATTEAATTSYTYDAHGNLLTVTDPLGFTTQRSYDSLGRMVTKTDSIDASTNAVSSYVYNRFSEVVQSTDALGYSSYTYYDRLGRIVASRDAENYVSESAYNVFGDLTSVTRRYNQANNAASTTVLPTYVGHGNDATTTMLYDRLGRVTRTTDAMNNYEQYTLNAFGDRVTVRNKLGGYITNVYDRRSLKTSETLPMRSIDKNGNLIASSVVNRFEYDARGNLTKKIEAFGLTEARTTTYFYDKVDRLIETRHDSIAVLNPTNFNTTSMVTPIERIKYDARGNIVERVDANGARTLFYYDKLNRKIADIGATGTLSTYAYDRNGNVLTTRMYGTPVALPTAAGGTPPSAPGGEVRQTAYTYDRLNRLKTTSMVGIRIGSWNGSSYSTYVTNLTASFDYDANGNVIKTTDASGAASYSYYDKLNRAYAKVDTEGYVTFWSFDAESNVLIERRYAQRATGIGTPSIAIAAHADDRHTDFTYDRVGNRLTEQRTSVVAHSLDGNGNLVGGAPATVTISYLYNGLGQVTSKSEATGDYVDFTYDSVGRLLTESRAWYIDQAGAWVRPTVEYSYDGINSLTLTRQGGQSAVGGDRYTRYTYEKGRLTSLADAAGAVRNYYYDTAGNLLRESYNRQKADGSAPLEGILYGRDALGRVTSQGLAAWNGSVWVRGDTQNIAYNAYGEVAQRGLNGMGQEQFAYDGRGRVWRSNSGDGVWRYFVYDANGRQTLALESEGLNLAGQTIDQVLAIATQNGGYSVGGVYVDGINATINVLDKRGMSVETRLTKRQLSESGGVQDLAASRGYNAFGEVSWERDARNNQVNYTFNTMGRTVSIQRPTVSITTENGTVQNVAPTDLFYYDVSGRLIGMQDANGNRTTRSLLAGTGYGGGEGQVTAEYHADGGVFRTFYDKFGDARILRNELNQDETRSYDAMGRLVSQTHRGGLIDYYAYDLTGQRIQHWNNVLQVPIYGPPQQVWVEEGYYDPYYGWVDTSHWETQTPIIGYEPEKEITDYDLQGRVTRQVAFGGDTTTIAYSWSNALATGGMGTFGGWTQTTTMANGRSATEQTDMFGRDVYKSDLGGHVYTFNYDLAGRMTQRNGGQTVSYNFLNSGQLGSMSTATGDGYGTDYTLTRTAYGYDATGNKTSEYLTKEGGYWEYYYDPYYGYLTGQEYFTYFHTYQNATASYDALGRMTSWSEVGNATAPPASIQYIYDAVGNVRRTYAQYRSLDSNGNASAWATTKDDWYRYDAMNRVVTAQGSLSGTQIVRGYTGTDYVYNQAGQRMASTRTTQETAWIYDPWSWDPYYGNSQMPVSYDHDRRETYAYDGKGNLDTVSIAETSWSDNGDGTITVYAPSGTGTLKGDYSYDQMGRLTRQIDYLYGSTVAYDRTINYNGKSQIQSETTITRQGADVHTVYSYNDFGSGAGYALGAVVSSSTSNYKNNVYQTSTSTTTSYQWWDGAVQSSVSHKPNTSQTTTYTTSYTYNPLGQLVSVWVGDGRPHSISFINDLNGQAIRRDESDYNGSQGDPHEVWYRFNGRQLGYTGNNGTLDTDYQSSINNRTRTPGTGAFRFGTSFSSAHAAFDPSHDPVNSYSQGSAAGSYTVRAGDTLGSIAAQLWGDSSLWYKLAEANGMVAANSLSEGQRLNIPANVLKSHYNSSTFKPYDPGETLGDTSPTTPQPQRATARKSNKCGVFGMILLVVIAVAVTVVTAGAAAAALSPAITGLGAGMSAVAAGTTGLGLGTLVGIGAASAAVGSIASQAFGVATGIQDKFSWKGVAMAAISGGVGAGLGASGIFSNIGNSFVRGAVSGISSSALTQGIGVVTGLQDKFDWAGIAAAGLGGGVSSAVGAKLGGMNKYAAQLISSGAGAIAGAAARSLVDGSSFGDNLLAALPGVIGSTIGTALTDAIANRLEQARINNIIRQIDKVMTSRDGSQHADGSASACFVAGTLVHTPSGPKPIEAVRAGDLVFAREDEGIDPTIHQRKVIDTYKFDDRATLAVRMTDPLGEQTVVHATPEHPFWVDGKGWTAAGDLAAGDVVVTLKGAKAVVTAVEEDEASQDVFNFAVDVDHTYFVGDLGVWVHNTYKTAYEEAAEIIVRTSRGLMNPDTSAKFLLDAYNRQHNSPAAVAAALERIVARQLRDAGLLTAHSVGHPSLLAAEQRAQNHFNGVLDNPPAMPNVDGLDVDAQYNVYASFILAHGDADAIQDLRDGDRVIVGLRQETLTTANNGQGVYDDRIVVLWRERVGNNVVNHVEDFNANTEPSAQYDWRAGDTTARPARAANAGYENVEERYKTNARGQRYRYSDGQDANGDNIADLGRLNQGVYRYTRAVNDRGGQFEGDGINHILRPDTNNPVQRDSNGDGSFNGNDRGAANLDEDRTMYFHPGGNTNTYSAGCQTFQSSDWDAFWRSLGVGRNPQQTFSYVLRNTR